jgi:alkylhydroperoxidase family enzyme
MPRVPLVDPDDAGLEPEVRELLAQISSVNPEAPLANVLRAVANHPELLRALTASSGVLYSGRIPPARVELAYIAASATNGCYY